METPDETSTAPVTGYLAIEFQHTETGPFANLPDGPPPLNDYADLLVWGRAVGVIGESEDRRLRRLARRNPGQARKAFAIALRIRDNIDDVFRAIATGGRPPAASTAVLARDEADALARAELVGDRDGYAWSWTKDRGLARPLWPVVHDATLLLTDGPLERLKACEGCRYLFIDESKNRSRRWCDMATCGTAEKIRRYVERRAAKRAMAPRST